MRARWGHTSPVGRHLWALISDKGLSVPRTAALRTQLPFQSHLSSPSPRVDGDEARRAARQGPGPQDPPRKPWHPGMRANLLAPTRDAVQTAQTLLPAQGSGPPSAFGHSGLPRSCGRRRGRPGAQTLPSPQIGPDIIFVSHPFLFPALFPFSSVLSWLLLLI